jgi:hypothetical protein
VSARRIRGQLTFVESRIASQIFSPKVADSWYKKQPDAEVELVKLESFVVGVCKENRVGGSLAW